MVNDKVDGKPVVDSDDEEWDWKKEAESIVKEFKSVVNDIYVSTKLEPTESRIYFNCETKEGDKYCIELTAAGFRICSHHYDTIGDEDGGGAGNGDGNEKQNVDQGKVGDIYYETMNALLDKMSPLYRIAFSNQLIDKLNAHCNDGSMS